MANYEKTALAQQKNLLEAYFEMVPDLLFLTDSQGIILEYRAKRTADLYIPPETFLGKKITVILPPDINTAFANALKMARSTREMQTFEYDLNYQDGCHHFECRLSWLSESECFMAVVRDISERFQMESDLERAQKMLQERFEQREIEQKALMDQLRLHTRLIAEISQMESGINGDIEEFSEEITELLGRRLKLDRVSVWKYSDDQSMMECLDLYKNIDRIHEKNLTMNRRDHPFTFDFLINNRFMIIDQDSVEPQAMDYWQSYMQPLGGTSLLACSILYNGQAIGSISGLCLRINSINGKVKRSPLVVSLPIKSGWSF